MEQEQKKKLHGYEFWKSIGSPKYVCAPMVGQSDLPFRLLVKQYGCQLAYSPMVNSESYIKKKPRPTQVEKYKNHRNQHFRTCKEDRPVFAQFCGNNPDYMLQAAQDFEDDVDAIDINLGCPQSVAKRGNYGSFLLDQPDTIYNVIKKLHDNLKIPVSAKIRILKGQEEKTIELVKTIEKAGASVLTVHGRSNDQKLELIKDCDWDIIKKIKQNVSIPVIANGGIYNYQDVQNCLEYTGVDAVMSCEGLLEYPALFSGNNNIDLDEIAKEYIKIGQQHPPTQLCFIKGHLCKFFYAQIKQFPELEILLNKSRSMEDYINITEKFIQARKNIPVLEKRGYYFRWWQNGRNLAQIANQSDQGIKKLIQEEAEQKEKKENNEQEQENIQSQKRTRSQSQQKEATQIEKLEQKE